MNAGFRKGLIDAALVCTQGAAALQEQRDAVKRRPSVNRGKLVWSKLESHGFSCASFGWPGGRQRIEIHLPLNKLYGVVYKHRSPDLSSLPVHNRVHSLCRDRHRGDAHFLQGEPALARREQKMELCDVGKGLARTGAIKERPPG